jgi:hypothetical protein
MLAMGIMKIQGFLTILSINHACHSLMTLPEYNKSRFLIITIGYFISCAHRFNLGKMFTPKFPKVNNPPRAS